MHQPLRPQTLGLGRDDLTVWLSPVVSPTPGFVTHQERCHFRPVSRKLPESPAPTVSSAFCPPHIHADFP